MSSPTSKAPHESSLTLAGYIILTVASTLMSALSALDPLGAVGLPLALLTAGLLATLSIGAGEKLGRAFAVYLSAPIGYSLAAVLFIYLRELPTEGALVAALPALWPSLMAIPIWLTVAAGGTRTVSIVSAAVSSGMLWILHLALTIGLEYGSIDLDIVKEVVDEAFIPVKSALASLALDRDGTNVQLYADADIDAMVESAKTVLIGASGALFITVAYLATLSTRVIAGFFELTDRLPASMRIRMRAIPGEDGPTVELSRDKVVWRIELDLISAIVLTAAYFLSLILPAGTPAELTASNLMLLLMPGFLYSGVREIFGTGTGPARGCSGVIFGFALILLNPLTLAMLLTVTGIISVIREGLNRTRAEKLAHDLSEAARKNGSDTQNPSDRDDTDRKE